MINEVDRCQNAPAEFSNIQAAIFAIAQELSCNAEP